MFLLSLGSLAGFHRAMDKLSDLSAKTEEVQLARLGSYPLPEYNPTPNQTLMDGGWEYESLKEEIQCLSENLYHEGRGQTKKGMVAINLVVINRVRSPHYPNSICDVVWQQNKDKRSGKMTAQFSWTLDGKSDKIKNEKVFKKIRRISAAMISGATLDNFVDFTEGATHYHADYVKPYWSDPKRSNSLNRVAQIDTHIFYKP
jgi:spore germination cell wall hydrolase CwlJ-like protein